MSRNSTGNVAMSHFGMSVIPILALGDGPSNGTVHFPSRTWVRLGKWGSNKSIWGTGRPSKASDCASLPRAGPRNVIY